MKGKPLNPYASFGNTGIILSLVSLVLAPSCLPFVQAFTSNVFTLPNTYAHIRSHPHNHETHVPHIDLRWKTLLRADRTHDNTSTTFTKRRNAPNSKVALQWVVEAVDRLLKEEALKSTTMSSEMEERNNLLLQGLDQMIMARSKQDALETEEFLRSLDIEDNFSYDVQERILKAAAMSGYMALSMNILNSMLNDKNGGHIPSYMAYTSVLIRLRKWKRLQQMREILETMAPIAKAKGDTIHQVALNTYLACLCDCIKSRSSGRDELLEEAFEILKPGVSFERFAVNEADTMSFNTVLDAAASVLNNDVIMKIRGMMKDRNIQLDVYSYNALLKSTLSQDDKLQIFDEIRSPDKYTIELMLIPLLECGRAGDIIEMLRDFNSGEMSEWEKSNAYSTFLISLAKVSWVVLCDDNTATLKYSNEYYQGGYVHIARAIFDTFILPISLEQSEITTDFIRKHKVNIQQAGYLTVKPFVRHFNALFEGYKSEYERFEIKKDINGREHVMQEVRTLFCHMKAMDISPDAYTITLLMGLQPSSFDISNVWNDILEFTEVKMTPPIYHSIISAYGKVNDINSACRVFDHMLATNSMSPSLNSWNIILGALAKVSAHASERVIDFTNVPKFYASPDELLLEDTPFIGHMEGLRPPDAARSILDLMIVAKEENQMGDMILRPTAQTYLLVATSLAHSDTENGTNALELFNDARKNNISIDGRFLNAIIRCYGDQIEKAIFDWKKVYRLSLTKEENIEKMPKNLIAAYNGLIQIAGRAYRPDIALRIAYAMVKEGVEPNETTWNNYNAGVRKRSMDKKRIRLHSQHEELLAVECTKYCSKDKRRLSDKRVRIII